MLPTCGGGPTTTGHIIGHIASEAMVVLRFSASKVALVTGLHDFGDVVEELLEGVHGRAAE